MYKRQDEHLAGDKAAITLQRLDAAALLWRVHLLGADVGSRWDDLAVGWDWSPASVGHSAFNDVHAMLVRIGQGRLSDAAQLTEAAQARAGERSDSNAQMTREVGLPLMRGLLAYAEGRCADAWRLIAPVRGIAHRFGGSHAQRDLITQTLLACAAEHQSTGEALLAERAQTKAHTPLTLHWKRRLEHHRYS